jgi:hypothetical protein
MIDIKYYEANDTKGYNRIEDSYVDNEVSESDG